MKILSYQRATRLDHFKIATRAHMMHIYLGGLPLEEDMVHCSAKESTYSYLRLSVVKMPFE